MSMSPISIPATASGLLDTTHWKTFLGRCIWRWQLVKVPNRLIEQFSEDFGEQRGEERWLVHKRINLCKFLSPLINYLRFELEEDSKGSAWRHGYLVTSFYSPWALLETEPFRQSRPSRHSFPGYPPCLLPPVFPEDCVFTHQLEAGGSCLCISGLSLSSESLLHNFHYSVDLKT